MSGDTHRNGDGQPSVDEHKETLSPESGSDASAGAPPKPAMVPTPDGVVFEVFGVTDVGLVREHNEDNFMIANLGEESGPYPGDEVIRGTVSERGVAFAVCDGMGGAAAGEVASHMAVDALFETLRGDAPAADRDSFAQRLVRSVEEAGHRIFLAAKKDRTRRGMGTTATVAGLVDHVLFVGQVGDSRCYILRDGRLTLVTKDQSLVNQLIEAGQLTEAEAEAFEHSNIILQALGTTEQVAVDLTFVELRRGDRLLLCSDGLSGLVHDDVIREEMACVGALPQLAERLVDLANAAGGHDNVTCIVADFDGTALTPPATGEAPFYQQYPLPEGREPRPALPRVVKSMVPGGVTQTKHSDHEAADQPHAPSFAWSSAATVLVLLGLAAVIAIVSVDRRSPSDDLLGAPPPPAFEDPNVPVEVKVRASLEEGELYVNGRSYGPLAVDEAVLLRLTPGAYHFEARELDGTMVGKDVVVEPGAATEVILIPSTD